MPFNIIEHVLDHAHSIVDNLDDKSAPHIHFNTSVDISYFIAADYVTQESIDAVMFEIINNISQKVLNVCEKNGIYHGTKKQKTRNRKIVFNKLLLAYHNNHFDSSKSVSPHIHIVADKKARLGIKFIYLRKVLESEAKKYNIKFNFMSSPKDTGLSSYRLKNLELMSWLLQNGDLNKIEKYIVNKYSEMKRNIDSLIIHYEYTNNLSFFMKILLIINQRLDELNFDYIYDGVNLKESIFFFLTQNELDKLEILKNDGIIKITLDNVFDRELLKYAHGFETEIMSIVLDKFNIETVEKKQLEIIDEKIVNNTEKNFIGFRDLVIADIRCALSSAKSQKEFKFIMLYHFQYKKLSIRSTKTQVGKREKIGFDIVTRKKTKMFISFSEVKIKWPKMIKVFLRNKKNNKEYEKLTSNLDKYDKKINTKLDSKLVKFIYHMPKLLKVTCIQDINHNKIENFTGYEIHRSVMYNIITLKNKSNTIVLSKNKIELKKSSNPVRAIQDILELVNVIDWNKDELCFSGNEQLVNSIELLMPSKEMNQDENIVKKDDSHLKL